MPVLVSIVIELRLICMFMSLAKTVTQIVLLKYHSNFRLLCLWHVYELIWQDMIHLITIMVAYINSINNLHHLTPLCLLQYKWQILSLCVC